MRAGDLIATLALLLIVAVLMIARVRRRQRGSGDRRALVEEFLRSHPGPVELRPARGTIVDPIVLASPDADRVLELLGERWRRGLDREAGPGARFRACPGKGRSEVMS